MLRMLFEEQPAEWTGKSLETVQMMEQFIQVSTKQAEQFPEKSRSYYTYAIAAEGLLRSLDELEQSCYAAKRYASSVHQAVANLMTEEERTNYHRHIYYDKNAYIRVFSLLDKHAHLLNQLLNLRTERMKAHFSYFTALRNMRMNRLHVELMSPLTELKEHHQGAMNRLRDRRNLEMHQLNAELKDDLKHGLANNGERGKLENLQANMADLEQGWEMVRDTLFLSFRYACNRLRK